MSTLAKTLYTPEEYVAIERAAETKSEYWRGQMYAMAGARENHNLITAHAIRHLDAQLESTPCRVYPSDMRVLVSDDYYTYPDVSVVCGKPIFSDGTKDMLLNPVLIIEVLSPSTEAYDRSKKFESYRGIASLREYLMIAQDRIHAELYTRQADGKWMLADASRLEDELELTSCGCRLKLADLYAKVDLSASA
jgi:Uma2 family endonuclease